jgi:hypothetical protein
MSKVDDIRYERLNNPWGLDDIELADKEQVEQFKKQNDELNKQYSAIFTTPSGKKVLEHLKKCTIDQAAWVPSDGMTGVHHGFIREGQNSIVRSIMDRIHSVTNTKKR